MKKFTFFALVLLAGITAGATDLLANLAADRLKKGTGTVEIVTLDGKPAIRLVWRTPKNTGEKSAYAHFSLLIPESVSLENQTLNITAVSQNKVPGFYVRVFSGENPKPVWGFMSWDGILSEKPLELRLSAGKGTPMKWEGWGVSGEKPDRVNRIEFQIGTKAPDAELDLLITGLAAGPAAGATPPPAVTRVPELPGATRLIAQKRFFFEILHPDSAAGATAARTVAEAVKTVCGVEVPFRPGRITDAQPARHAVMLGNLFSNPALRLLYVRKQTLTDEFLPGPGGHTVESVIEPFRRGADVIVLGASDDAGVARAAAAFGELVKKYGNPGELTIPITFEPNYTAPVEQPAFSADHIDNGLKTAERYLNVGQHQSLGGLLAAIGDRYRLWRNPLDARLYAAVAQRYAESAATDPRKFGGPWGFDSDFPSYEAISGWDLIEHDAALNDDDRLATVQTLLRWLDEAIAAEAILGSHIKGPISNHITFASLGTLMGGLYFSKYYQDELAQPKLWLETADMNFARQAAAAKVFDDCDAYMWLTWRHVFLHALARPNDTVFANGVARRVIETMGITMDNLGAQSPYGDSRNWNSAETDRIVLDMYHAATGDELAAGLLAIKRRPGDGPASGQYYGKVADANADAATAFLSGLNIIRLDAGYYRFLRGAGTCPPLEKCFDKFSFRESLNPSALYLLVDGVNNGGHRHADANSVLRYSHFGREWLAENDYVRNQQKYHNSLLILTDGEAFDLPDYPELVSSGGDEKFAYAIVRAAVGPADWTRCYLWLKAENAWLLIDEVSARRAGDFRLTQRWYGIGEMETAENSVRLRQGDASVRVDFSPDAELKCNRDAELEKQWLTYPYAEPVIHAIDRTMSKRLSPNESVRLAAVWHGDDGGRAVPVWQLTRQAEGLTLDTGKNRYAIKASGGKIAIEADATPAAATAKPEPRAAAPAAPKLAVQQQFRRPEPAAKPLTNPFYRPAVAFRLTGVEPAGRNPYMPGLPNRLASAVNGTWGAAEDSVMYKPGESASLTFEFDRPRPISQAGFRVWWAEQTHALQSAEAQLSDDGFVQDIRTVKKIDLGTFAHTGFDYPIEFLLDFAPQTARSVRLILTPRAGSAVYLGEATIYGQAAAGETLAPFPVEISRLIRVKSASGDTFAFGTAAGEVFRITPEGRFLNQILFPAGVNDLATLDLDDDGEAELLAAAADGALYAVKQDGKPVWSVRFERYRTHPAPTIIKTADLDGDGKMELVVGCNNWRTYAIDRTGKIRWNFEVVHSTRAVEIADLDGDGHIEILAGTRYFWMTVLDRNGLKHWGGRFGVGCRAIAAPLSGDRQLRRVVS